MFKGSGGEAGHVPAAGGGAEGVSQGVSEEFALLQLTGRPAGVKRSRALCTAVESIGCLIALVGLIGLMV
eukprot:2960248-Prymnesium_polylepis.1